MISGGAPAALCLPTGIPQHQWKGAGRNIEDKPAYHADSVIRGESITMEAGDIKRLSQDGTEV